MFVLVSSLGWQATGSWFDPESVLLAFWVPLCILLVYDLEPSSLGFFVFSCFIIYLLFIDQKKKKKNYSFRMWIVLISSKIEHLRAVFMF